MRWRKGVEQEGIDTLSVGFFWSSTGLFHCLNGETLLYEWQASPLRCLDQKGRAQSKLPKMGACSIFLFCCYDTATEDSILGDRGQPCEQPETIKTIPKISLEYSPTPEVQIPRSRLCL